MIHLIGGGKTGYNLFKFLNKNGIKKMILYHFLQEYSQKKSVGIPFKEWQGIDKLGLNDKVIITSETAFNHLSDSDKNKLPTYYFIRNKENFKEIAQQINAKPIPIYSSGDVRFPIALKPKDAMEKKVPFKFIKVNDREELEKYQSYLKDCILQPFLDEKEYSQIAVAGYFDGLSTSLIAVEQKNHYPKGISAYVVNKTLENKIIIENIASYLTKIDYKGFIEFEFKKHSVSGEYFLMDINPRPWGWFYYYLDGIQNFSEHLNKDTPLKIELKPIWVNFPRLLFGNLKGNFSNPSISNFIKGNICYEPYF